MKVRSLPIDTVIEEYLDLTDHEGTLDEGLIKKWADNILSKIITHEQLVHKIKMFPVQHNSILLPENFHSIIQVMYRYPKPERCPKIHKVYEATTGLYDGSGCEINMTMDCPNCANPADCSCGGSEIIIDIDRFDQLANPQWYYGHSPFYRAHGGLINGEKRYRSIYHPEFEIIKPAEHYFFNADYHIQGCLNLERKLCADHPVEYQLDLPRMIINEEEGDILLSYYERKTDSDGHRLVPDDEAVFEAIKWQIEENMTYREWRKNRQDRSLLQNHSYARDRRIEAQSRAKERLLIPDFQNWWSFIENHYMKIEPYYDWFEQHNRKRRDVMDDKLSKYTDHRGTYTYRDWEDRGLN